MSEQSFKVFRNGLIQYNCKTLQTLVDFFNAHPVINITAYKIDADFLITCFNQRNSIVVPTKENAPFVVYKEFF